MKFYQMNSPQNQGKPITTNISINWAIIEISTDPICNNCEMRGLFILTTVIIFALDVVVRGNFGEFTSLTPTP